MQKSTVLSRPQSKAPQKPQEFPITNFDGLNNNDDPASVLDTESPELLNVIYDHAGSIQNRKGYIKLLTTTLGAAITGMFPAYKSDGTKQLVYPSGTQLYKYDNAGGSTSIGTGFTSGKQWDFDIFQNIVFGTNAADGLVEYDFSATSISVGFVGSPQNVRTHKNRIWLAGDPSAPSRLYFSDAGSTTSFPVNNFIDVNTNDGQQITGLERQLDSLIVFKTDSIWIISGEPLGSGTTTSLGNLSLRRANSDVGCVSFRTICEVQYGVLMFAARSGLYVFQNYQSQPISKSVNGTFKNGINPGLMHLMWANYNTIEKKYLLGYPSATATSPDKSLVYDFVTKKFSDWDDIPGACSANFRFNDQDTSLMADPVKGIIYRLYQGSADIAGDNGTATGGSTTTLVDSTKAWVSGSLVDAKIYIISGTGQGQTAVITANTATTITFATLGTAPAAGSVYTIGGYTSYWKSKIFDFGIQDMTKKYKYLDIYTDSEGSYNLLLGMGINSAAPTLGNIPGVALNTSGFTWDQFTWDSGVIWDGSASLFKRASIGGNGRYIQVMFGQIAANEPWRTTAYTIRFKTKKARPV